MLRRLFALLAVIAVCLASIAYTAAATIIEAPKNLSAELKYYYEESPYFELYFEVPEPVQKIIDNDELVYYMTEHKIGNGEWVQTGSEEASYGNILSISHEEMGLSKNDIDIKANTYYFRVKIRVYSPGAYDANGNFSESAACDSAYSNTAQVNIAGYQRSYSNASSWAVDELDKADRYGFITDKIKDKMNAPITREEFAEIAVKLYVEMSGDDRGPYMEPTFFSDTRNPLIYKAFEMEIVNGVGNGKFAPNELTNREQVAAMVYRAIKVADPYYEDFSIEGAEKFKDENLISSWALIPVKFMSRNGFIKGTGQGEVGPKGTTTREQAVLMIVRVFEKYML